MKNLKKNYFSTNDKIGRDFFMPCLKDCITYKRASAYFSSTALITFAKALPAFTKNEDAKIKLIIHPILIDQDLETLKKITLDENDNQYKIKFENDFFQELENFKNYPADVQLRLKLFAYLISKKIIEIKFAFPHSNQISEPLFHPKFGVFDFGEEKLSFSGSANETITGHSSNIEMLDVFFQKDETERIENHEKIFDELWENKTKNVVVKDLSKEIIDKITIMAPDTRPNIDIEDTDDEPLDDFEENPIWSHQDEARDFVLEKKNAILSMATGTGKTKTSFKIIDSLQRRKLIDSIIITMNEKDLINQWKEDIYDWLKYNKKFQLYEEANNKNEANEYLIDTKNSVLLISRLRLASVLKDIDDASKILIIHDEVHELGSQGLREDLGDVHDKFTYKLGLSATYQRAFDEEGTNFIHSAIAPESNVFSFGIDKAIEKGVLCEFEYHPLTFELTDEDRRKRKAVYGLRESRRQEGKPMSDDEFYRRLSDVIKLAELKPLVFDKFIQNHQNILKKCIIFIHSLNETNEDEKAISEYSKNILSVVQKYSNYVHTYVDKDAPSYLEKFANGSLECIVAVNKVSQGIDIPSIENIVLFSSDKSMRQTIQRLGRCLRIDKNNPNKKANVVDFIVDEALDDDDKADKVRYNKLIEYSKYKKKHAH